MLVKIILIKFGWNQQNNKYFIVRTDSMRGT